MVEKLLNSTIKELKRSKDKKSVDKIRAALEKKDPESILLSLQKSGTLPQYFEYFQKRACLDRSEIKSTIQGDEKPVIHILIDLHILSMHAGESSKIIWNDPNIINPQGSYTIDNKRPAWKSQTEIADICGVKKQAIQKQVKTKFKPAMNADGKINRWHPLIVEYKEKQEEKRRSEADPLLDREANNKESKLVKSIPRNGESEEVSIDEIYNLTLEQIVDRWGGVTGFKIYVDTLEKMSSWKMKEQKYRHSRKELIEKVPTVQALFSIINMGWSRIVNDYPNIITDRLIAKARSSKKTARIEVVELQQQTLSEILKAVKKELVADIKKIEE